MGIVMTHRERARQVFNALMSEPSIDIVGCIELALHAVELETIDRCANVCELSQEQWNSMPNQIETIKARASEAWLNAQAIRELNKSP